MLPKGRRGISLRGASEHATLAFASTRTQVVRDGQNEAVTAADCRPRSPAHGAMRCGAHKRSARKRWPFFFRTGVRDGRKDVNAVVREAAMRVVYVLLFVAVGVRRFERALLDRPLQFEVTLEHGPLQPVEVIACLPPQKRDCDVDVVGQNLTVPVEVEQRPAFELVRDVQLPVQDLCQLFEDVPPAPGVLCARHLGAVIRVLCGEVGAGQLPARAAACCCVCIGRMGAAATWIDNVGGRGLGMHAAGDDGVRAKLPRHKRCRPCSRVCVQRGQGRPRHPLVSGAQTFQPASGGGGGSGGGGRERACSEHAQCACMHARTSEHVCVCVCVCV